MKSSILSFFLLRVHVTIVCAALGRGEEDSFPTLSVPRTWPFDDILSFDYYHQRCPQLEQIINTKLKQWIKKDRTLAASLLRLHFHDCMVSGCDASVLLNHEGSERRSEASKTLRGFQLIDDIKAEVEKSCPSTVCLKRWESNLSSLYVLICKNSE